MYTVRSGPRSNENNHIYRFGVICAFTTNEVLEEGVTNLPEHVRIALTDTELYLNNTEEVNNCVNEFFISYC